MGSEKADQMEKKVDRVGVTADQPGEKTDPAEKKRALAGWMEEYGTGLLRMCFLYLRDLQLAEDVTQETFFRAYREYEGFRGEASVKSWLTRIAINLCKDQKKQAWFRRVELGTEMELGGSAVSDVSAQETVLIQQRNRRLLEAVQALPRKSREVVLMYYYQELKLREIGEILGVSEKTVSSRLARARERLRQQTDLKGWWRDETEIG